jgi:hypothetical protein
LKSCSSWRDEDKKDPTGMLDRLRDDRHRQLRCVREERCRRQMHNGADRAVIVAIAVVMLRGGGLLAGRCGVANGNGSLGSDAVEVQVPERQRELQRHRRKRQPSAPPPLGTNPTHHVSSPSHAIGAPTHSTAGVIVVANAAKPQPLSREANRPGLWPVCNKPPHAANPRRPLHVVDPDRLYFPRIPTGV